VLPYLFISWVSQNTAEANQRSYDLTASVYEQEVYNSVFSAATSVHATAFPPTMTPLPTATPTSTFTPSPDLPQMSFLLSFYDPHIGVYFPEVKHINCLIWSDELNDCVSRVNNGQDEYHTWYRRGVACPPPLHDGQRLRVISPVELRNISEFWTCIDRGDLVQGYYLDFMLRYPDDIWTGNNLDAFPWSSDVLIEVQP